MGVGKTEFVCGGPLEEMRRRGAARNDEATSKSSEEEDEEVEETMGGSERLGTCMVEDVVRRVCGGPLQLRRYSWKDPEEEWKRTTMGEDSTGERGDTVPGGKSGSHRRSSRAG